MKSEVKTNTNLKEEMMLSSKIRTEQQLKVALIDEEKNFILSLNCDDKLKLSEEFLKKNWEMIKNKCGHPKTHKLVFHRDIRFIIRHSSISEEFIVNYLLPEGNGVINYVFNYYRGRLSEEFIEQHLNDYKNKLFNSFTRYLYNNLGLGISLEFLFKYIDKIDSWIYSEDSRAKLEIIEKFIEDGKEIDWYHLSLNENMNKEFFMKYWDRLYLEPLLLKSDITDWAKDPIIYAMEYGENEKLKEKYKKFQERRKRFNDDELLVINGYYHYRKEIDKLKMTWVQVCKDIKLHEEFIKELLEEDKLNTFAIENVIKYQDISEDLKTKLEKLI